jgi:predicted deacylase
VSHDPSGAGRASSPIVVREDVVLDVREVRGAEPGPTVTLVGGIHGDEPEGVLSVRRVLRALDPGRLSGRVRGLATANPPAHAASSRETPEDGMNLARVFPGDPGGSLTERIAAVVTDKVLAGSDLVVDLHSAGTLFEMPLFCGFIGAGGKAGAKSAEAARAFGTRLVWRHEAVSPGRTVSVAAEMGIPCLYAETQGGGGVRGEDLDAYVGGVLRVLATLGMLPDAREARVGERLLVEGGDGDLDRSLVADREGLMVSRVRAGQTVRSGELLAEVFDDEGEACQEVRASRAGIVMMLRRRARVQQGDPVALVAPQPRPWRTT